MDFSLQKNPSLVENPSIVDDLALAKNPLLKGSSVPQKNLGGFLQKASAKSAGCHSRLTASGKVNFSNLINLKSRTLKQ